MIGVRARIKMQNRFGVYGRRLPKAVKDIVWRTAQYGQSVAQTLAPVDTGALRASIYINHDMVEQREKAFGDALGKLETAKRQYIAYHRVPGGRNPRVNVRGRRRYLPHTRPEQMFPRRSGFMRYGFGMPRHARGPYQADVIAGMWYAPHQEYPTQGRAGKFYMRRAAQQAQAQSDAIARVIIGRMLS